MIETFTRALESLPNGQRYVVALSGGADSTALLHLCAKHAPKQTLAVHINHGLSPNASNWAQHCADLCDRLSVPFALRCVDATPKHGQSPEDAARIARYEALLEFIDHDSCLLTAHHLDDQTETVLLQLFRGAGPRGLSAMPRLSRFGEGHHARPVLDVSRAQILEYLNEHELSWINDESNLNEKFDRNFIRQQLMPLIVERWPGMNTAIARVAEHCAQTCELLDVVSANDLKHALGNQPNSLSKNALQKHKPNRQRELLRFWLHQNEVLMPSTAQLEQIVQQFLYSSQDAEPHFSFGDFELRRYQDDIFLLKAFVPLDPELELFWQTDQSLVLPAGLGTLTKAQVQHPDLPEAVVVRFRRGGECGKLVGRDHTHSLKNLFQEWGVPPWMRGRIPMIYDGDRLLEVIGYAVFE